VAFQGVGASPDRCDPQRFCPSCTLPALTRRCAAVVLIIAAWLGVSCRSTCLAHWLVSPTLTAAKQVDRGSWWGQGLANIVAGPLRSPALRSGGAPPRCVQHPGPAAAPPCRRAIPALRGIIALIDPGRLRAPGPRGFHCVAGGEFVFSVGDSTIVDWGFSCAGCAQLSPKGCPDHLLVVALHRARRT